MHLSAEGAILIITLDRPEALNALDPAAHAALDRAFDRLRDDDGLRCAVITGSGRAFCVGSDLKARAQANADDHPPTGLAGFSTSWRKSGTVRMLSLTLMAMVPSLGRPRTVPKEGGVAHQRAGARPRRARHQPATWAPTT